MLLALDTATSTVAVAVARLDGGTVQVLARAAVDAPNRHGECLAPLVDRTLAAAGVRPGDLNAVAVGLGPGPFTGLRVGIVTAAALADAWQLPAYGVCSLDVLAAAQRGRALLVVTDARRRQVYWARYDADGRRVEGPELAAPADLAEQVRGTGMRVVGPGLTAHGDAFAGAEVLPTAIDAAEIPALVADRLRAGAPADPLTPLYLRRPDAVPPGPRKKVMPT